MDTSKWVTYRVVLCPILYFLYVKFVSLPCLLRIPIVSGHHRLCLYDYIYVSFRLVNNNNSYLPPLREILGSTNDDEFLIAKAFWIKKI